MAFTPFFTYGVYRMPARDVILLDTTFTFTSCFTPCLHIVCIIFPEGLRDAFMMFTSSCLHVVYTLITCLHRDYIISHKKCSNMRCVHVVRHHGTCLHGIHMLYMITSKHDRKAALIDRQIDRLGKIILY